MCVLIYFFVLARPVLLIYHISRDCSKAITENDIFHCCLTIYRFRSNMGGDMSAWERYVIGISFVVCAFGVILEVLLTLARYKKRNLISFLSNTGLYFFIPLFVIFGIAVFKFVYSALVSLSNW